MKKSIKRLPKGTQTELAVLQELILSYPSKVRMIILYGSYARKNYVLYEEGYEFGSRYVYQSDLDILLVVDTNNPEKVETKIRAFTIPRYEKQLKGKRHITPPQIIVESVANMNRHIRKRQYFFTEIVKEGILLYDDGQFVIPKAETLRFREIKERAEAEYEDCFTFGEQFLEIGYVNKEKEQYKMGSFQLHQACERFYKTVLLVFINYRPKWHELKLLDRMTKRFSRELACVFPKETPEEKLSYQKLCDAYIHARYDKQFTVSKEQLEYMITYAERLRDVTAKICAEQLAFYEEKAHEEEEN